MNNLVKEHKSPTINNYGKEPYNLNFPQDNFKSWNQYRKSNLMPPSYYNGSDWQYTSNIPPRFQNKLNSPTYYFYNNPYSYIPYICYNNYPYSNDKNGLVNYPVTNVATHCQNNYRSPTTAIIPRYNNINNRNNYANRRARAGKQYVYDIKKDFHFKDDGEYIDDNITDMEKMKEIETMEECFLLQEYDLLNRRQSPTNEELYESTSSILDRASERAKDYLNFYGENGQYLGNVVQDASN